MWVSLVWFLTHSQMCENNEKFCFFSFGYGNIICKGRRRTRRWNGDGGKIVQLIEDRKGEKLMEQKIGKLFGKPPKQTLQQFLYIKRACNFYPLFTYTFYTYSFNLPLSPVWYLPSIMPECHWILKIWRHLDCVRRIIFRFQLIYHCRVRTGGGKVFPPCRDLCLAKGIQSKGKRREPILSLALQITTDM